MKTQIAAATGLFAVTLFMAVSLVTVSMAPAEATTRPATPYGVSTAS